jgi:hypothetical protein
MRLLLAWAIKRVLSVTSLDLSHALPADLFRRHASSTKEHSEFALSHCVAYRGALALQTVGQFGALPHAQIAKRPSFNNHHFRRRNCDSFAK